VYIAVTSKKRETRFFLRESCKTGDRLTHRDLADLGNNPGSFIKYPGGNAFYVDEELEDRLNKVGANFDDDHLEDLFWPWIRPDVRRAVETFKGRSQNSGSTLTTAQKEQITSSVIPFDKRRVHYLKFAAMDQGPIENMPPSLFLHLPDQCRDEIEQNFIRQEIALKPRELKSYVYTVFDLQSYFRSFMAKEMPHALDQKKVDEYFIKELCRINQKLFKTNTHLDDYMIRYAIMFFDHQYADTRLLDQMANAFMNRHRFYQPVKEKSIPIRVACKAFNISRKELKTMTKKQLTRIYRKLARQVHPDTGGSNDRFVELNNAYKTLQEKTGSKN